METERLTILGKSDATITMILDNLESNGTYPAIQIVNNLALPVTKSFDHPAFTMAIHNSAIVSDSDPLVLGVFQAEVKEKVYANFGLDKTRFVNLIHQSASLSTTVTLGTGCLINSLVSVAAHTRLGDFVSINRNASVGHHTVLEDFVTINPGCTIAGNVTIGKGAQIGMGTTIIDGVSIGEHTVIGAGSVVTRSVPAYVVAYGSPARIIRER